MFKFAGIKRGKEYSPNHLENDSLIFNKTIEELENLNAKVCVYDEDLVSESLIKEKYIFNMIRGSVSLEKLFKIEENGAFIINPPRAILNCYRENMAKLLPGNGVPFPKSILVNTNEEIENKLNGFESGKLWVKRGDVHAIHREDVTLVYNKNEMKSIIKEYERRGIKKAIIQENLDGDVIKFYGVKDSDFFYWYYLNGTNHTTFDVAKFQEIARKSAEVLGVTIYGGDAIISPDGSITVIDLNDWPSYAPIRDKAAKYIAEAIYRQAKEHREKSEVKKSLSEENISN